MPSGKKVRRHVSIRVLILLIPFRQRSKGSREAIGSGKEEMKGTKCKCWRDGNIHLADKAQTPIHGNVAISRRCCLFSRLSSHPLHLAPLHAVLHRKQLSCFGGSDDLAMHLAQKSKRT